MSSTTITRGNVLEAFYIGPTLTPASVAASTTAVQTFSLPGLKTTDIILVHGVRGVQTTGIVTAETDCYTDNVLSFQFANVTAGALTPFSGTYILQIVRAEGPLPLTAV
jgi:hypothetical protein